MAGFPSPFGDDHFDPEGTFVPEHLPDPGPFLEGHDVLAGDDHLDVHDVAHEVFEVRTVYDMTFDYNLARLNRDTRHPGAGYRYAREDGDPSVLRAEFTPTTPFCPQSGTLTVGSFRAWNGLADRHEFDLVRVRVHPMHHASDDINDRLASLAATVEETGEVPSPDGEQVDAPPGGPGAPF